MDQDKYVKEYEMMSEGTNYKQYHMILRKESKDIEKSRKSTEKAFRAVVSNLAGIKGQEELNKITAAYDQIQTVIGNVIKEVKAMQNTDLPVTLKSER